MNTSDARLIWTDVETTGLKTKDGKHLLEVAALITDFELNLLDEEPFHAIIKYDDFDIEDLKAESGDYVRNMHEKSGLWDKLTEGTPREKVDADFLAYIKKHAPNARQGYLAGNSVSLDRDFVETFLPKCGEHLHYRIIDISTLATLIEHWYGGAWYEKELRHEALSDIKESLEQLKWVRRNFFVSPNGYIAQDDWLKLCQEIADHATNAIKEEIPEIEFCKVSYQQDWINKTVDLSIFTSPHTWDTKTKVIEAMVKTKEKYIDIVSLDYNFE